MLRKALHGALPRRIQARRLHKDADTGAASGSEPAPNSATAQSDDDADSFDALDLVHAVEETSLAKHEYASNGWTRSKKNQWAKLLNLLRVSIAKARKVLTCIQPDASRRSFLGALGGCSINGLIDK